MPYIKLEERRRFAGSLNEILNLLRDQNDNLYIRGEYFGFFVNRVCKRFLMDPEYHRDSFNSFFFNEGKKKTLTNATDTVAAAISRGDPLTSAGELNYVISAVLWGFLGQAEGFNEANYGLRTYLRSMVERIMNSTETVNVGSQRDMAMAFRRHLVIRGVLGDVVSETYRRFTAPYEDRKLYEVHGDCACINDIWVNGKLNLEQSLVPLKGETRGAE